MSQGGQSTRLTGTPAGRGVRVTIIAHGDGPEIRALIREVAPTAEIVSLDLPAVVTCDLRLNKPRFASLPGIMKSKKAVIPQLPSASLAPDLSPRSVVRRFSEPVARKGGVKVADVEELWRRLHDEAKVL